MVGRLDGKAAVVIGGARGIGRGIADLFAAEGARLIIADTDREHGVSAVDELSGSSEAAFVETDISREEDAAMVMGAALERYGRLDILVQNAGIYPWTPIESISVEEWDRVLAVNLRGCFLAAREAFKSMREQRYGRIVFTSSITGPRVSSPGHGHYSASKAGINGFIRAAAVEFAPHQVTVNGVEPGNILTEGMQAHRSPEFIRAMEAAYITGTTIVVDGGQIVPEGSDLDIAPGV